MLLTTTTLIMAGVESLGGFMIMFAYNLAELPAGARGAWSPTPTLLADAIEESLRFNTSAQRFRRRLQRDVELHGQTMKAGDFVCLAYGSGNRDERQFPIRDRYDIARKPRGHLGFGGGVHACLGTIGRAHGDEDRLRGVPQGRARLRARRRPAGLDAVLDLPQPAGARAGGPLTTSIERKP